MSKHEITRTRQDTVKRTLHVVAKQQLTPCMLRVILHSDEIKTFQSPSPDDHIKIFLSGREGHASAARDFTPRTWDAQAATLTLDFALHPHGPAADWARQAQPGDTLEIGGPRGSTIIPNDFDWYLLAGDATALPSMARRLEELPPEATVYVIALVADRDEEVYLSQSANRHIVWLHTAGDAEQDAQRMQAAVEAVKPTTGDGFLWIAAEVSVARGLYTHATGMLAHPKDWVKAAGYWSQAKADGGERIA